MAPGSQTEVQAGSGPRIAGRRPACDQPGSGDALPVSLLFLLMFTFNL